MKRRRRVSETLKMLTVDDPGWAAVSEANAKLTPPPVPEGLCGALSRNTETCVLTPHQEGTPHSWER